MTFSSFREVWAVDTEFTVRPGELPIPICIVAHELLSGRRVALFGADMKTPFYACAHDVLIVAYFVTAELSCFFALGWPPPTRVLDLYVAFRAITNGLDLPCGRSLLGALAFFGLDAMSGVEKEAMRALAMRGAPFTDEERRDLLNYCAADVDAVRRLLDVMAARIDLARELLRGRCMIGIARVEAYGVPVDTKTFYLLRKHWETMRLALVDEIDADYGVFAGTSFRSDRFEEFLIDHAIPWSRLPSGRLALDDETFRERARAFPLLSPLRELRHALSDLRLNSLDVGRDGRNRVMLSPFGARTSRNTPSSVRNVFGPSVWIRSLIQPPAGRALAYVDWSQQEFGIAAALSGDEAMMDAYASGDPYLEFGKQAGRIPSDGTKESHRTERELFKQCVLATQYGMEAASLATRIGSTTFEAAELLRLHRNTYRRFWSWSDAAVDHAMLHGYLLTVFGWPVFSGSNVNIRSLRNFPMQANGAEMMRLACALATERGISVCAPVHDAFLIEADIAEIEMAAAQMQRAMAEASACVLGGFPLRSDVKIIRHPERYSDPRGARMWAVVCELLAKIDQNVRELNGETAESQERTPDRSSLQGSNDSE